MVKDGGPAFPLQYDDGSFQSGMSLRDYFAAHAPEEYLMGVTRKWRESGELQETEVSTIMAAAAFMYADAMLKEREKQ